MIGFIITGHNNFASGIVSAAEMIMGSRENLEVVDFEPDDDISILDKKIDNALMRLDTSGGAIVFTDIAGGSPFNRIMLKMAQNRGLNIHVISGTNLPLLVEALCSRQYDGDITKLIDELMSLSPSTIRYGNEILKNDVNA